LAILTGQAASSVSGDAEILSLRAAALLLAAVIDE
jgi:hypothetical protein